MDKSITSPTPPYCKRVDHVLFLKTHKTGSSTLTNLLNRYGNKHELTFALPQTAYSFNWPHKFRTVYVVPVYRRPHILCNHARFNKKPMNILFPKKDTKYLTILRHPVTHFESIFNFMKLWDSLNIKGRDSIEIMDKFLQGNSSFNPEYLSSKLTARLLRNPMLFDLGMDYRYFQDLSAVWTYIQTLHKEFDLVLIMEYFDESMVLMKRTFCWDIDDVLYLKLNERRDKDKRNITEKMKQNILSWSQADMMLYRSFNKTFWKRIENEGPAFYYDLARFRERKKEVFDMCVKSDKHVDQAYSHHYVKGYLLRDLRGKDREFCRSLVRNELNYLAHNLQRHRKQQEEIDDLGEFPDMFDKRNNWDVKQDLAHHPVS
ncbi:galactosylceramide sulfotransferase isoform X2 [Nematostella vectensis]|nr:galactosylceramide sulfotransferase isoform X2 [Nematostella vectensis]